MTSDEILIAGERLDVLERLIPDIEFKWKENGNAHVRFTTDLETGAAWQRARERTAADLITPDSFEPFESRLSTAFARILSEVAVARGLDRSV